jgi:hypothetical protein
MSDDSMKPLYDLIKDFPKYKETRSHVIPSQTFKIDSIQIKKEKPFIPMTLPQIGKKYVNT